ncbi:Phytoene desaturase (neurosporene-forming) [Beijerinckiaceae bacterium RH AL1]|nr:phytoene desaturase [Beijerinckiaceae bacterium]VVB47850.1 Phytoene desaturase (neurosporene-forming) [Beijerinckiaceae bacterium RH CH11]VVB47928.1 Phytoene desaturase (neurosporene-forming) [Beijerinckiaceae bacterium RH AL8]VVC56096.1 Phytoene desaturase (neurosporene-forming) [Beijerinckiaceae bacterium RH AL1]
MTLATLDAELPPVAPKAGDGRPHAVVIGSGFGGLAAAVRLGARGYRVTVLEKRGVLGGRAAVYRQDGFTFDAGPTIVTAPFLFEELWALAGKRLADDVDLRPVTPFYEIRFETGEVFHYTGDAEAMRAEVARFSPGDVAGYERFMAASEQIFRIGFEELGDVPFSSWRDMAAIVPAMVKLRSHRSVYGYVSSFMKDERLRTIFSFHPLLIGGNPFSATSIYCLICFLERRWGVHFAMGGTGRLVTGLAGLIEGQGGALRTRAAVDEILLEEGRATGVRLADGETIAADIVVSNADSATTYRELLPRAARKRWTDKRLDKARYSMGLFVWYFGTKRRYENVAHHTIVLGPRYRGLLDDIFTHKHLADDFSLYLHRPTATDPSLAPDGCDAFYVLSPVPHLQSGTDWGLVAERYRRAIADKLEATLLPGLADNVVTSRMMTPQDFADDLSSLNGAAFGLEPVLTQSAWFRPHNVSEEADNLFLVGAGTHPGAGLPGVLSSARILDKVVPHATTFS